MIADWTEVVLVLALPLLLGGAGCRAIGLSAKTDPIAIWGWRWCVGALALAGFTLAWLFTAPDVTQPWPLVTACLLAAGATWFVTRHRPTLPPTRLVTSSPAESVFFLVILGFVLLVQLQRIVTSTLEPVLFDDEANFWATNAKVLFESGGFTPEFATEIVRPRFRNTDYPLLNPLLQVWTFAQAGEITHVANRFPIQAFALAQTLIFAGALRRVIRPALAGFILLAAAAAGEATLQLGTLNSDLLVGLGALVSLDAWWRWQSADEPRFAPLAAIGLALSAWAKNEGTLVVLAALAAVFLVGLARRPRTLLPSRRAAWLVIPIGVLLLSAWLKRHYELSNLFLDHPNAEEPLLPTLLHKGPERLRRLAGWYFERFVVDWRSTHGALHAFLFGALLFWKRAFDRRLAVPLAALFLFTAGVVTVFLGTPHTLDWHLNTAAVRVHFQSVPVAWLIVAALAGGLYSPKVRSAE